MKVGTKSVLFGAHCFFIHPIFVFAAWCKLYGFPWDPRLWVAFFVHDIGYWGKPNMDGDEGETHPEMGADIMCWLFDFPKALFVDTGKLSNDQLLKWTLFTKYHSRFLAKKEGAKPSRLCFADKLSICLEPSWLYLPRVNWSGEIHEYMSQAKNGDGKYKSMDISTINQKRWFADVCNYLERWVEEHKDGREDSWTPEAKKAITRSGVWQ